MTMPYAIEHTKDGTNLVVTGVWSSKAAAALIAGEADGLVLNYAKGFQSQGSIAFLTPDLPVKRLYLLDRSIEDPSPIGNLSPHLTHIAFEASPGVTFDMNLAPKLKSVAASWKAIERSVRFASDLEVIATTKYDAADLLPICTHVGLRVLQLKDCPDLQTLKGLSALHKLEVLRLMWAVRLSDLSELAAVAGTLTELRMERCRSVRSLDDFRTLKRLKRLEFSDGPTIPSFAPLADLRDLETLHLWGSTRPEDNDLSPLLNLRALKDLRIKERREFQPPVAQLPGAKVST